MEPPGRCGDWLAPPPSPSRAHAPGRHDERGMRTFIWPPARTYTWPSTRTFPWPWTPPGIVRPTIIGARGEVWARQPSSAG